MAELYGAWKVSLPNESYTFEPDEMLGTEWALVEDEYGGTFDDWIKAIDARSWSACQVLIWFLRRQNGTVIDRDKVDFKIRRLVTEKIPDPEDEAGTSPSVPATSEPSPDTATDPATSTP